MSAKLSLALILAALLLLSCCPLVRVLSVSGKGAEAGESSVTMLSREAARNGFVISYTHSVNKGRVRDSYACRGKALVLEGTLFVSYGAGIPETDEIPGASFSLTDSGYEITGMNRRMDELLMAVGLTARHSIAVRQDGGDGRNGADQNGQESGTELFLEDIFERQTPVLLKVRRVPLLYYLLARKLPSVTGNGHARDAALSRP